MTPVRVEPEAAAELEDAAVWYEEQRAGLGSEFVEAVERTLEHIARWPRAAQQVPGVPPDVPARRAPVTRFPYHVAYLETRDNIRVLAIAHDRREPAYWHPRLKK